MFTHNLHNFSELEDRIALLHMQQKEVNTSVVSLESQIRHLREMLKYAEQYQKNKIYDDHYKSSKDPDRYFRKYESQIILFAGSVSGVKSSAFTPSSMKAFRAASDLAFCSL